MSKFQLNISQTISQLLLQEDTDNDKRITIEDKGLKRFVLQSTSNEIVVEGTYFLSNLLQELILAQENNHHFIETDKVFELPANRISRMIKDYFWNGLKWFALQDFYLMQSKWYEKWRILPINSGPAST